MHRFCIGLFFLHQPWGCSGHQWGCLKNHDRVPHFYRWGWAWRLALRSHSPAVTYFMSQIPPVFTKVLWNSMRTTVHSISFHYVGKCWEAWRHGCSSPLRGMAKNCTIIIEVPGVFSIFQKGALIPSLWLATNPKWKCCWDSQTSKLPSDDFETWKMWWWVLMMPLMIREDTGQYWMIHPICASLWSCFHITCDSPQGSRRDCLSLSGQVPSKMVWRLGWPMVKLNHLISSFSKQLIELMELISTCYYIYIYI